MPSQFKIQDIKAREILDSRGNPTLAVKVYTDGAAGEFSVPSGASTGIHEAWEKRDGNKSIFQGKGVQKAAAGVNGEIKKALKNKDVRDQKEIDDLLIKLDGTSNKKRLGANAILGVSVACAKAAAGASGKELHQYLKTLEKIRPSNKVPYLYMNLINAGKHASSYIAFQEFMIVPMIEDVEKSLVMASQVRELLRKKAVKKYSPFSANYGDEGGFVIEAKRVREPFELLSQCIKELGYQKKVKIAIDAAASSFYEKGPGRAGKYAVDNKLITAGELHNIYKKIIRDFDVLSIEDPFFEEEFDDFAKLLAESKGTKIIGDDLTVTNPDRLKLAIENCSINGMIIKPNQIGTLSETLEVMKSARENNVECIVSHRSGETSDDFIADLAFAFGAFGLKAGAPNRGERTAKYNRLWEITK